MAGPVRHRSRQPPGRRPRQRYQPPDLDFFPRRTPQSLYWLGFLMADGCATHKELIVALQRRDEEHLRSLLAALGCSDRPLTTVKQGRAVRVAIGSVRLARQLNELGVVAGRAGSTTNVRQWMAESPDFWRGVVDGDGSIRFHPTQGIPMLEVVGAPGLMWQFAMFLESVLADGEPVKPFRHSQSSRVRMVKVGGRRAKRALRALYLPGAEALRRKRERAIAATAWEPSVRSRYPWDRWGDGTEWVLRLGVDYDKAVRLWEAGRRAARARGMRLLFTDRGDVTRIRFVSR